MLLLLPCCCSALDDHIVVDFDTGRYLKPQYIQCKSCKQIKCLDEFVSKHSEKYTIKLVGVV